LKQSPHGCVVFRRAEFRQTSFPHSEQIGSSYLVTIYFLTGIAHNQFIVATN
jgi:hypothetical protein